MNSKAKLKIWSSTVFSLETKAAQNSKRLLLNIADISCGYIASGSRLRAGICDDGGSDQG